ncbi:hypothetical protein [Marinoscillum sp. MHG1-6]|uniref:hypothetical protein n=1 Tax=Marinoscillum sp. MHG1-6 TaxID=2959627 RepID=UPI002156F9FF|nr:hypothetical protein [Marinoscillum sp. MHG1-6]
MISSEAQHTHHLVYQTKNTTLLQCDDSGKYVIRLFDQEIVLSPCALIAFKKRIKDIDMIQLFDVNHSGIEIISLTYCDRIFVFSIQEILELRDLLEGTFTMLELNSMIHKAIRRQL